jgi:hypothetical protein
MRRRYPGHKSYSLRALCEIYASAWRTTTACCDARAAAKLLNLINEKRDTRQDAGSVAAGGSIKYLPRIAIVVCSLRAHQGHTAAWVCFPKADIDRQCFDATAMTKQVRDGIPRSKRFGFAHCSGIPALRRPSYVRSFASTRDGSPPCAELYAFHAAIVVSRPVEGSAR